MVDFVYISPREKKRKPFLFAKQSKRVTSQFHQDWLIDQKGYILPEQNSDMFINHVNRKSSLFLLFCCRKPLVSCFWGGYENLFRMMIDPKLNTDKRLDSCEKYSRPL